MGTEGGYKPDLSGDKKSKSRWKEIAGAVAALGTAAYLALPKPDSSESRAIVDPTAERKPGPEPEPIDARFFPPLPSESDPDLERPAAPEPNSPEPPLPARPSPADSVSLSNEQLESIPPELQEQVSELHKLCGQFYNEDLMSLINPLRVPIVKQIKEHYDKFAKDAKKYPGMGVVNESSFCGPREDFEKRHRELISAVVQSNQSGFSKFKVLMELIPAGGFYSAANSNQQEIRDLLVGIGAKSSDPNEAKEFYRSFLKYGRENSGDLTPEEYDHTTYRLSVSLSEDKREEYGKLYTDEERKAAQEFVASHDYHYALTYQASQYRAWDKLMNEPPASGSSQKEIHKWQVNLQVRRHELIKSIKNSMDEGQDIDPTTAYGCPYSLEELEAMDGDFK